MRRKSPRGHARLEYYLTEKACSEGKHRTSISLDDLTSVSQAYSRTHSFSFLLVGIEIKIFLSADTEKETQEWIQLIKELVLPEPKLYPSVQAGDIYGKCNTKLNFILNIKQFFKLPNSLWKIVITCNASTLGHNYVAKYDKFDRCHKLEIANFLLKEP